MRHDLETALCAELGGHELPSGLARLRDDELEVLLARLRATRERHTAALARATEEGLSHIPALLRTPVRKLLGL